ncbi:MULTISPECIES: hypothetical protein [unclassified Pseudomonas]|uniref:hypothetical protein n=1 Tax=unclassified Pseudomonas TaxID=196821 RepID=UPI000A1DFC11|nr:MULTISPECIES: hypothetical protein [unclassified Pseudomonas]
MQTIQPAETQPYHAILDVYIDRKHTPGQAILRDVEESTRLFSFTADMTDEQIVQALRFATVTYRQGQLVGSEARAVRIRAALGVPAIAYADA